jgi:thiosulfate dehydrogenase
MHTRARILSVLLILGTVACSKTAKPAASADQPPKPRYKLNGPLVPARMTMVAAWDVPQNPLVDKTLDQSKLSKEIQLGYRLFTNTPAEAPTLVPGGMSCNNCHTNAGQRERALPLVGISGAFPEYNRRAGRLISLTDRIVDCFLRSENATGRLERDGDGRVTGGADALPTPTSREVLALAAYLNWISRGSVIGKTPAWRGQNTIPQPSLKPVAQLDPKKGEAIYAERCASCHGPEGQGVFVGDRKPGPLWGPDSWNDGAGAARTYTLAGIIRYTMPYLDPGNMTDEDALNLAAFITAKPRPSFPYKDKDYLIDPLPSDAVYYPPRPAAAK